MILHCTVVHPLGRLGLKLLDFAITDGSQYEINISGFKVVTSMNSC